MPEDHLAFPDSPTESYTVPIWNPSVSMEKALLSTTMYGALDVVAKGEESVRAKADTGHLAEVSLLFLGGQRLFHH